MSFAVSTVDIVRARRLYTTQTPCQSCGEKGYLRYDDDSDEYVLCDLCGKEQT